MNILVTGAAGFIGYHLTFRLIEAGHNVIGYDNINDYYSVDLKYDRLKELGVDRKEAVIFNNPVQSKTFSNFVFYRLNLEDRQNMEVLFKREKFDVVCHLAAQAGVRYSLKNPYTYIDSNIVGFINLLECCRHTKVKHLVYASSSSVYGSNEKIPFSTEDNVDHPISLYAATKKSNELMAHTYSHLFDMPTTGLRFFTVYGPWGRPDMALFLFTEAIEKNKPIKVFNYGKMERDFTYVKDIVEGLIRIIEKDPLARGSIYKVYNIGNNNSIQLMDFIREIEKHLGKKAKMNLLPIQPGDVAKTWADVSGLIKDYNYQPNTTVRDGIKSFIEWYKHSYN